MRPLDVRSWPIILDGEGVHFSHPILDEIPPGGKVDQ
jgi:hypothetical protein